MIELYRIKDCPISPQIESALREMVLAHRVIIVESAATPLPALKDEGKLFIGEAAIQAQLLALTNVTHQWRKYESDSCYIEGEDGSCL